MGNFFLYEFIFSFFKLKLNFFKNLLFFIWKMIKFPKFNRCENLENFII